MHLKAILLPSSCVKDGTIKGKQEISALFMSFSKSYYFSIVLGALYLSSTSVSVWIGGGELLSKKRTSADRGKEGVENWQVCGHPVWMTPCAIRTILF